MSEEKIIGWMKNIGEFVVSTLVEETDETLTVKDSGHVAISAGPNNQTNIQFVPLDILSIKPLVSIRNLMLDGNNLPNISIRKSDLLYHSLELSPMLKENYLRSFGKPVPVVDVPSTEDAIIKLF